MTIFNVTEPITLLLLLAATVLLIFLGKETKKSLAPGLALVFYLVLVIMHSVQLASIPKVDAAHSTALGCITVDIVMIFISFFAYLWVDDISSKFYKKKSIDNSLDWFWNKV